MDDGWKRIKCSFARSRKLRAASAENRGGEGKCDIKGPSEKLSPSVVCSSHWED